MKLAHISMAIFIMCLLLASTVSGQAPVSEIQSNAAGGPAASIAEVPRLINFSGTLRDEQEQAVVGPVGVTFALYAQQTGGAALWMETQNVKPDGNGNYAVLLGANSAEGVPAELFASTEARWLGIQVGQQPERERVLLVSVPYALKAKDAETLGGLPASAFLLSQPTGSASGLVGATTTNGTATTVKTEGTTTKSGAGVTAAAGAVATNYIPVFTSSTGALGSSTMYQSGTNIGVGTATPAVAVDVVGNNGGLRLSGTGTHQVTVTGATSGRLGQDANGFFFASDTKGSNVRFLTNNGALNEWMRITSAGNVGIGTTTPAATLNVVSTAASGNVLQVIGPGGGLIVQSAGTSIISGTPNPPNIVAGFSGNTAGTAYGATVGGGGAIGAPNSATAPFSTVSGGYINAASLDYATVSGGYNNTASGGYAAVCGGALNIASGTDSFAAGYQAQAIHDGTFVWNDNPVGSSEGAFTSTAANQFLIRARGGVGIGTSTPSHQLEVLDAVNTGLRVQTNTPGGTVGSFGGFGDFQIDGSGLAGGRFIVRENGFVGIGTAAPGTALHVSSGTDTEVSVDSTATGGHRWTIQSSATQGLAGVFQIIDRTAGASRVSMDTAGNVGIGTNTPDDTLTVNGTADKPGGGSWGTFSDGRLKNVNGGYHSGLKQVLQLNPIRYEYKKENPLGIHDSEEHIGFVAQDVARVLPEAVSADSQGYLLVNNDPILWAMLNAIKEQHQEITKQERDLTTLRDRGQRQDNEVRVLKRENAKLREQLQEVLLEVKQVRDRMQTVSAKPETVAKGSRTEAAISIVKEARAEYAKLGWNSSPRPKLGKLGAIP